jgi:hypothetical protein
LVSAYQAIPWWTDDLGNIVPLSQLPTE